MSARHVQAQHGPIEAAPIPGVTPAMLRGARTHWGALVFTMLVAGSMVWGATRVVPFSITSLSRPAAPVATAAPAPTPAPTAPAPTSLGSAWVSQSAFPALSVGGTASVSFTFRNTGTATWQRGTLSELRLGVVGAWDPAMNADWLAVDRPAAQSEAVVLPGGIATFTFKIRGVSPGTYRLRVRPVVDGVAWLSDEGVYVEIGVR